MSCQKAIGVAKDMKEEFGDKLTVDIFTLDSPEALNYTFKSSTNVLFEGEKVPLGVALDKVKLTEFIAQKTGQLSHDL
jgi:hypothetical protein